MNSDKESERLFQWIKGDNIGTIETVVEETANWTKFKSGRRINTSLISEFMIDIAEGALDSDDLTLSKTAIPPQTSVRSVPKGNVSENPIETLIKKSSKIYNDQIAVSFNLNIPSPELVKFISDSFGEDETIDCVKTYLINQISIDSLKDAMNDSICEFVEKSYK